MSIVRSFTFPQLQTQFQGWRNKSSVLKVQAGELEEATKDVVSDIKLLRKSVSEAVNFPSLDASRPEPTTDVSLIGVCGVFFFPGDSGEGSGELSG